MGTSTTLWTKLNRLFDACGRMPHVAWGFVGFGLLWLWGCCTLNVLSISSFAYATLPIDTFSSMNLEGNVYEYVYALSQAVGLLTVGLAARRFSPYFLDGSLLCVSLIVCILVTACIFVGAFIGYTSAMMLALAIIAGIAYSSLFLLWVEVIGCLPGNQMIVAYLLAVIVYFVTSVTTHFVDPIVNEVFYACLPVIVGVLFVLSARTLNEKSLPMRMTEMVAVPWQIVLLVAIFSVVFDLSGGFVTYSRTEILVRFGRLLPVLIILACVMLVRSFDFPKFYGLVITFMILGLIGSILLDRDSYLGQVAVQSGAEGFSLLVFVIVCSYAYRLRISAAALYGPVAALSMLVRVLFDWLSANYPEIVLGPQVLIPLCLAGILILALIINRSDFVNLIEPIPSERRSTKEAVKEFSDKIGLSTQEQSILLLLVEGKSTSQIADALYISASTVRVHLMHACHKAGVGSREELVACVSVNDVYVGMRHVARSD